MLEQKLDYHPGLLSKLPKFGKEVDEYIEQKTRKDLPIEQFNGTLSPKQPRKFVEIGGILGYDSKNSLLKELSYVEPDRKNVYCRYLKMGYPPIKLKLIKSRLKIPIYTEKIEGFDIIINWHTHPLGEGTPSREDITNNLRVSKKLKDKEYYFIIFQPNLNKSFWYQMQNNKPF